MVLTDNELGMIEQLTYLNSSVAEQAGVSGFSSVKSGQKNMSISQILERFDENSLICLENKGDQDINCVSAKEWAGIIRYLKSSKMKDLILCDTMINSDGTTLALCFAENGNTNESIVAFKGTSGGKEWVDNVEGLNVADTQCQKDALNFIESLPYDNITVTGHSKGGNKAMYVTVTSDKVTRCVAYDGQGFSQEFIDKYWAEIQARGNIITAYSLSTDYVHALLFPVPNSEQVYCQGYGVANIGEHHSPNSFYMTDENGKIILDENGSPIIIQISENESIVMLHDFTTFILNNSNGSDKIEMVDFVSQLLLKVFGGKKIDSKKLIDFVLDNPDALALIIAYLIKYMEVNDLSSEDIDKLLSVLGLDSLDEMFTVKIAGVSIVGISGFIDFVKGQLTDGNDDWWIKNVWLPLIEKWQLDGYDIDISAFWEKINSKVKEIDGAGGCGNAEPKADSIRDFSSQVYEVLMNAINQFENMCVDNVSVWNDYAHEEWYSSLFVSIAVKGINGYFSKLTETNMTCKTRIDAVFNQVKTVDNVITARLQSKTQNLQNANTYITSMANNIVS